MKIKLPGGSVECDATFASTAWQQFYQAILRDEVANVEQLKHDGTTTVYIANVAGVACVVKRYNTKNSWHFVRRGLRRSRADICYKLAGSCAEAGILTPAPIAKIQAHFGPFKLRSWYLCHYQAGDLLADVLLQQPHATAKQLTAVQDLFRGLVSKRLSHGDMKATNLIWHNEQLVVIDLDGARQHPAGARFRRAINKDKRRFIANWQDRPELKQAFEKALDAIHIP